MVKFCKNTRFIRKNVEIKDVFREFEQSGDGKLYRNEGAGSSQKSEVLIKEKPLARNGMELVFLLWDHQRVVTANGDCLRLGFPKSGFPKL